jgi:hypothetical protein
MEPSSVNPDARQSTEGLDRRDFLKGASVIGGSLMTGGLVAGPRTASAESISDRPAATATLGAPSRQAPSARLTPKEQEVLGLIREGEVASVLQDFVRIPTAMSNEQEGAEYFARRLREWGIPDAMIQGIEGHPGRVNLVARLPGRTPKGPTLMVTSHLDSIHVDDTADEDDWIVDPFSGAIRNGRVYGLGASDNKSGCVAKVMAAKAIKQASVELPGDLLIGLVADEEGYMLGISSSSSPVFTRRYPAPSPRERGRGHGSARRCPGGPQR